LGKGIEERSILDKIDSICPEGDGFLGFHFDILPHDQKVEMLIELISEGPADGEQFLRRRGDFIIDEFSTDQYSFKVCHHDLCLKII
jgi:hypothetical protein